MENSLIDKKFLSYAIRIAKKNLGRTAQNPCVACVIVKDGVILATGVTDIGGRPHAEINAIDKVVDKKLLHGSTLYVTLEPCCHNGAKSCAYAIIQAKISRVVIATLDPDLRVNGFGAKELRAAKIEVTTNILEDEAREINKGFLKVKETGLPYVTLKVAVSLDGKIATRDFDSKWISSEASRRYSHYLRSINDAIMVGANTLNQDNPSLDCRIKGLESYSPRPIVVSNNLKFSKNLKFFQNAKDVKPLIITGEDNRQKVDEIVNLENGVRAIFCESKENQINLKTALIKLGEENINSVLVEGGSALIKSLLQQNLIDEIVIVRSSKIIGNDGIAAFGDMNFSKIADVTSCFKRTELIEIGGDLVEIYKK